MTTSKQFSLDKKRCLYCAGEYTRLSREHIISESLGCRVSMRDIACNGCNSKFGHNFEAPLFKTLLPIVELALPAGRDIWKVNIHGKSVRAKEGEDQELSLVSHVFRKIPVQGNRVEVQVIGNVKQAKVVERNHRKKGKKLNLQPRPIEGGPKVNARFSIDFGEMTSAERLRAVVKYAVNYFAYTLGKNMVVGDPRFALPLKALRSEEDPNTIAGMFFNAEILERIGISYPHHTCLLTSSGEHRNIIVVLVLFGMVPFYVVLAQGECTISYKYAHQFSVGKPGPPKVKRLYVKGWPELRETTFRNYRVDVHTQVAERFRSFVIDKLKEICHKRYGKELTIRYE